MTLKLHKCLPEIASIDRVRSAAMPMGSPDRCGSPTRYQMFARIIIVGRDVGPAQQEHRHNKLLMSVDNFLHCLAQLSQLDTQRSTTQNSTKAN